MRNTELEFQRYLAQSRGQTAHRNDWMFPVARALDDIEGFDEWFSESSKTLQEEFAENGYLWPPTEEERAALYQPCKALSESPADRAIRDEGAQPRRYCGNCGAWNSQYPDPCPVCYIGWAEQARAEIAANTRAKSYCALCGQESRTSVCPNCIK